MKSVNSRVAGIVLKVSGKYLAEKRNANGDLVGTKLVRKFLQAKIWTSDVSGAIADAAHLLGIDVIDVRIREELVQHVSLVDYRRPRSSASFVNQHNDVAVELNACQVSEDLESELDLSDCADEYSNCKPKRAPKPASSQVW